MTTPAPRSKKPSEFGGVPGLIQPPPHEPTNTETLLQIYATEPAPALAIGQTVEEVVPPSQRKR